MDRNENLAADRTFEISTALGPGAVAVHRFRAREELARMTEIELDLLSARTDLAFDKILGTNATVKVRIQGGKTRAFNGFVTRFSYTGFDVGRYHLFRASMRPWPWLLTRAADCRIFQQKSVPDILKEVFKKYPDARFEDKLSGKYAARDYCVQYRETDFNFVSRLMEQEGIYYFFRHEDGRHTLVLADSVSAHQPGPDAAEMPFIAGDRSGQEAAPGIVTWDCTRELQPGRYVLCDYDFTNPKADLLSSQKHRREHGQAEFEMFDYPGEYVDPDLGKRYARTRVEELQSRHELTTARSTARTLCTGNTFKLAGHVRQDQNREYLIVAEDMAGENNLLDTGGSGGASCESVLTLLSGREVFRPLRATPKPFVQGPQTAVVVGPGGEEIWTDKYGRVKVQFHWDRYGKRDENSSCWIRVSHPWAGSNWGMVALPRIGQEVVIDFLEGDPDQPLITGRVYNADQMPPYELPANATQTGIKSRSSKGGSGANANEIRFEDKKGSEQLLIHAEKNQDIEVENDETHWVGHDRRKTVDNDETTLVKHDRTETVGNNEKITIGVDRTESVGSNETIAIGANRTETVGANESISIASNRTKSVGASETVSVALQRTHTVGVNETIAVGGAQEIAIGGLQAVAIGAAQTIAVGAYQSVNVAAKQSVDVGSNASMSVGGDESRSVEGGRSTSIGKDDTLKVAKNLIIDAGESVTIKTGSASITMKKDGTIAIQGKDISIKGSGAIDVKASKSIAMKGQKILQN
jgi:type VI secretion system secreted protein VgrG